MDFLERARRGNVGVSHKNNRYKQRHFKGRSIRRLTNDDLTGDVLSSVRDVDVIQAGGEGNVLHAAAAIFVVFAGHL